MSSVAQPPPTQPTEYRIIGLDLSLTATGICDDDGPTVYKSKLRGPERLDDIARRVFTYTDHADLVVLEGYSYASHNQAHQLGELGGVVRRDLWTSGTPYVDVAPALLKRFATGKGNANKSAMGLAAARNGYNGPGDDNAIDAWWLRELGIYATTPEGERPFDYAYRDEATAKIDWPK